MLKIFSEHNVLPYCDISIACMRCIAKPFRNLVCSVLVVDFFVIFAVLLYNVFCKLCAAFWCTGVVSEQ